MTRSTTHRRRVAVITGTRAEFGLLVPVLRAMKERRSLDARLIVTGMHLLRKFGRTIDQIRDAGWRIDATVRMQTDPHGRGPTGPASGGSICVGPASGGSGRVSTPSGRGEGTAEALAVARGVAGIARAIDKLDCEIVLVLGDRIEAFAGACAAGVGRRVLAHIHGGDRATGDVDDALRNAISRLAHVHLVTSKDAADRLTRMGEPSARIHRVGAPGLDDIRLFHQMEETHRRQSERPKTRVGPVRPGESRRSRTSSRSDFRVLGCTQSDHRLRAILGPIADQPYAVLLQHPRGQSRRLEAATMRRAVAAVEARGLAGVAIFPNSDPGHEGIIDVLAELAGQPQWRTFRSLVREDYLGVVSRAAVLLGNSSSGIIESASLTINAVNIGPRQRGRLRCGPNVIDCGESAASIAQALSRALSRARPAPRRSVYGDGRAGQRIAAILERLIITPALLHKELTY